MRRHIILLLIIGTVWAQTDFDELVILDGKKYLGEFSKINKNEKTDKYFVILIACSVIMAEMIYIINQLEGLCQSPGPIFTIPDA